VRYEGEVLTRAGHRRLIAWHDSVMRDAEGGVQGSVSSGEDITERRRAEEALLHGQQLEAVGVMAGGVATRFNGALTEIGQSAAAIASNSPTQSPNHREAMQILDTIREASALTRGLMTVAHASDSAAARRIEPVHLAEVVRNALGFVGAGLAAKGMANASEAMPGGGVIVMDAICRRFRKPGVRQGVATKPGTYAVLRIRDTGRGISKEDLKRVFVPFFTTDRERAAFGLGLPLALNAMRRMGGWIAISSTLGKGTVVQIALPRAETAGGRGRAGPGTRAPARRATVLLVESRPALQEEMKDTLEEAGYAVHAFADAQAAMGIWRRRPQIAAAVLDAGAPGGLKRLAERLAGSNGPIALVFTSGFSRAVVRAVAPARAWSFLQKPFERANLLEVVSDALRQSEARAESAADG
jgi:CheY-like chemotaxis protein